MSWSARVGLELLAKLGNRRAGYLDGVFETAEIVTLRDESPDALVDHIADQIRQLLDVDRDGLPTDENTALLVTRANVTLGHFLVTAASQIARPSLEQRKVAVLLADQAGSVVAQPER